MKLLAHITEKNGIRKEQSLYEHSFHTAEYASESLKNVGFYHMAYMAGLLHDMGKATRKFNNYLEDAYAGKPVVRGSVNHTFAGVIYLLENYHKESSTSIDRLTAEVISYAVGAHHGLFDCVDLNGKNGFIYRLNKDKDELCYEEALRNFEEQVADEYEIGKLFKKASIEFESFYRKLETDFRKSSQKIFFQIGLLARLLLSAVIYGDRKDTGEFMNGFSCIDEKSVVWQMEKSYFEQKLTKFDMKSELNQVRNNISEQCLRFAEREAGIYRLNVPTGGGKTLCTLRYALAHAEKFHKKRIIFIIPLLSVLDQNVKVIREYIQDKNLILEHHSNTINEKEDGQELDRYEVLTENWGSPVIVSTLVQLLNILFVHKTSAIGRMRVLCDSIIVIDEVQSLPKKTIAMFNMAINFLSIYCNATIVLSSATQPCLEELHWPVKFANQPDMVHLTEQQLNVFERADIIDKTDPYGMDMEEWASFCYSLMESQESLLVICNTKNEARSLYKRMREMVKANEWDIYHLSTAMCQTHRMDVLEELQNKLHTLQENLHKNRKTEKIICISTQLVEAGVDFSFECVVRVLAGIDNLAQATGRCNRNNEYGHKGKVYLINLKKENLNMLKDIVEAQNSTKSVLNSLEQRNDESLIGEYATRIFYRHLFHEKHMERQIKYPIDHLGQNLYLKNLLANDNPYTKEDEAYYMHQPFKTVGKEFQVFDEQTVDVMVPYGNGKKLIEELRAAEGLSFNLSLMTELIEQAKRYTISIYQWQRDRLWEEGVLFGLFEDRLFVLDEKAYDPQYGLNDQVKQTVENYIL